MNDETYGLFAKRNLELRNRKDGKKANIIVFDTNGAKLINQNVGLVISSGFSRYLPIKSMKFFPLDKKEKIRYRFNNGSSNYSKVINYNSLRLSANGQEQEYAYVRNSSIHKLAAQSNFDGYKDIDKYLVFINGDIYGVMNIENMYSDSFLKDRFRLKENKVERHKENDIDFFKRIELYDKIDDLNEENKKELEEKVDIDNLLLYYAIELLTNNSDWPQNNYEAWKYNGNYDKNNKYTDGKYRFLLYDLDLTYLSEEDSIWKGWGVGTNKFYDLLHFEETVFYRLMKDDDYRNKFTTIVNNLNNTTFSKDNTVNVFTEEFNYIKDTVKLYKNEDEASDLDRYFQNTINYIENRNYDFSYDLRKYLDAKKDYTITFKTDSGSMINIENLNINNNSEITYTYSSNNVTLKGFSYPGYTFDHFVINGDVVNSDVVNVSSDSVVEAISKRNKTDLIISELKSNENDYIVLTNISDKKINLGNYYLSDKKVNLLKYQLPSKKLKPNQSVIVYGRSNIYSHLGDLVTSFNLKYNENIYLYNKKKNVIEDNVHIPKMNKEEVYFRENNSNIFKTKLKN